MTARRIARFALVATAAVPALAVAATGVSSGPASTLGQVSHPHAAQAGGNPAGLPLVRRGETSLLRGGVAAELGPVNNLIDELDDLQDELDDPPETVEGAEGVKEDFDDFLVQAGEDGYAKVSGFAHVPFAPLALQLPWGEGAFSLDVRFTGQSRLGILDAPLEVAVAGDDVDLTTNTSLYVKGAVVREISAGYGREVYSGERGQLFAGATLRHYHADLSKIVVRLQDADDVGDTITDEYDANQESATAVGADLGLLWASDHYRVGLTGRNLNEPTLDYPAVGQSCGGLSGTEAQRCEAAQGFGDRIDLEETWTLDAQGTVEGALYTEDQSWVVAASVDTNEVRDPVGDEFQWAAISVSTVPQIRLMPEWRFGYRENLAGSELSYVTTGLTLFRALSLDIAYGLDSVDYEDESYPRSFQANVGLDFSF